MDNSAPPRAQRCGRNVCRVLVVVGFQSEAPWLYDGGGARLTPLLPLNHANNVARRSRESVTRWLVITD